MRLVDGVGAREMVDQPSSCWIGRVNDLKLGVKETGVGGSGSVVPATRRSHTRSAKYAHGPPVSVICRLEFWLQYMFRLPDWQVSTVAFPIQPESFTRSMLRLHPLYEIVCGRMGKARLQVARCFLSATRSFSLVSKIASRCSRAARRCSCTESVDVDVRASPTISATAISIHGGAVLRWRQTQGQVM